MVRDGPATGLARFGFLHESHVTTNRSGSAAQSCHNAVLPHEKVVSTLTPAWRGEFAKAAGLLEEEDSNR